MYKLKRTKGITLVALIITIIVLLILAGVSISMLLGENGLINKSQSAINTYKEAENQENALMKQVENYMDQMIAKNNGVLSYRDLVSQTPGNATPSDIASGKVAWVNGDKVVGAKTYKIKKIHLSRYSSGAIVNGFTEVLVDTKDYSTLTIEKISGSGSWVFRIYGDGNQIHNQTSSSTNFSMDISAYNEISVCGGSLNTNTAEALLENIEFK